MHRVCPINMTNSTWLSMLDQITAIVKRYGSNAATIGSHKRTIMSQLEQYEPKKSDFEPYIHFDPSGYTKNLVREINQDDCNVIIMCWAANQSSAFHAHEGSRCFVKVLSGQLSEQQVAYPSEAEPEVLAGVDGEILNTNDVTYIDDSIGLHRVSNLSNDQPAITLHIYMPAYKKCRIFNTSHRKLSTTASELVDVKFNSVAQDAYEP